MGKSDVKVRPDIFIFGLPMRIPFSFVLIALCSLLSINARAQDTAKVNAYYDLVKTWGVLKYYSPAVNKGTVDWDSVLVVKFEVIANFGPDSFYHSLNSWVKQYAYNKKLKPAKDTIVSGFKNVDSLTVNSLINLTSLKVIKGYYFKGAKGCNYPYLPCFKNELNYDDKELWRKEVRFLALARFWNIIEYFYPYKDQLRENWDSVLAKYIPIVLNVKNPQQFEYVLLQLSVSLHDAQTHVNTSGTLGYVWNKKLPPIQIKQVEGKAVITAVYDDSLSKTIKPGMVVTEIEGEPADSIILPLTSFISGDNDFQKANSLIFDFILAGKPGSLMHLKVQGVDGKTTELKVERKLSLDELQKAVVLQLRASGKLNDSIGYINAANTGEKEWERQMKQMKTTKGLVIDLRQYPQWSWQALHIYFVKHGCGATLNRTPDLHHPGRFLTVKDGSGSGKERYKGKVAVLVSEGTISRGEYFAMLLKQCGKDITFVGTTTAGGVGTYTSAYLPGSIMVSYTGTGEFYDNHETAQRKGLTPGVIVNPTIKGLQAGRDEVLEKAVEVLR